MIRGRHWHEQVFPACSRIAASRSIRAHSGESENPAGGLARAAARGKQLEASYEVAVVGADDKVQMRSVKVGELFGSLWIIEAGLQARERVVVEGLQKVRDGELTKPMPWIKASG